MWLPKKSVGMANGVLFGIMAIFEGVGFFLIPQINALAGSWRETLFIWALLCAAGTLVWTVIGFDRKSMQLEPDPGPQVPAGNPLRALINYKEPWVLGLGVASSIAGRMAFDVWWPTYIVNTHGIAETTAGQILAVISISGFPSSLGLSAIPWLVRNPGVSMLFGGIVLSVSYVLMLYTGSLTHLFLLGLANGLSFAWFPIMMASLYNLRGIRPRDLTVVVALVYTIMWGGAAIGPVLTGFVAGSDENLRQGILVTCLGPLGISLSGLWIMLRRPPGRQPEPTPQASPAPEAA